MLRPRDCDATPASTSRRAFGRAGVTARAWAAGSRTGARGAWLAPMRDAIERRLEAERDQLVLWLPVALGAGVAAWFVLPDATAWRAALLGAGALAALALAGWRGGRFGVAVAIGAVAFALGCALIWTRAERVRAPVLTRPAIVTLEASVTRVDPQPARDLVRLRLDGITWRDPPPGTPPTRLRVNVPSGDAPNGLAPGARVALRARLMPPAPPAVPGAYDFARVAWFDGIGATGRALGRVTIIAGGAGGEPLRAQLSQHIQLRVGGSAGGIAAALVTGDVGGIAEEDQEAMRRSGLAHLLSVSGLHIAAVVGLTMLVAMRLLALSERLALTGRVPLLAAGAAALAAIGYTLLAGGEVPTVRSCVAALLVLAAMALGREAVTLRLVAVGAIAVLLLWPESIVGASFQLSFAAVTAIVALHESARVRGSFAPRDEGAGWRIARGLGSLLLTGVAVEAALMPIAVFHFHQAGLYGALANIVAIPLTTFVIMPLEAGALALDAAGLGAPLWWLAGQALRLLLWIAHVVADAPGAVAALPAMPRGAFALMIGGLLWLALWRTRWRIFGLLPAIVGAGWAMATPPPDLLVTGDGRHVGLRLADGRVAMLRDRAGDYVQDMLAENGGSDAAPVALSAVASATCTRDLCRVEHRVADGRRWRILATRSAYLVPAGELIAACRRADIVISERRLPRRCTPRWLRLDRTTLAQTGGVAVAFASGRVDTVRHVGDAHPWIGTIAGDNVRSQPAKRRQSAEGRSR